MKLQVKQQRLIEILDYLYVDGLFPFAIISTTPQGNLMSMQTDNEGLAFRRAVFSPNYFKSITKEEETVKIDVDKIKKFANLRKSDAIIEIEYPAPGMENKLRISCARSKDNISTTKIDEKEIKKGLPFEMKRIDPNDKKSPKIPWLNKGAVALDTRVAISLNSFREIVSYAGAHGTEFYKFQIGDDGKLNIRIGNLHELDDFSNYSPHSTILAARGDIDITFTNGIKELAKTVSGDVHIYMRSNLPAWFSEKSKDRIFGVLLSPVKDA